MDIKAITGPLADFLLAQLEGNKQEIIAQVAAAEGSAEAAIHKALLALPKPGGLLGLVFPKVEASLEDYAKSLVAKYGPEVIFVFLDAEARMYAKQLGG
ncbi:MAG: hypothetical protein NVSMB14_17900 [Isosphaeraceae bacterium]